MSKLHNDSGGYLGARPTQNTSSHPGVWSEASRSRDRREGNWVTGTGFGDHIPQTTATAPPSGGVLSLGTALSIPIGRSGAVGNDGTAVTIGADDTCVNVKTDANGTKYLTVTNAANYPTPGGNATSERRTLYYYHYNSGYSTAYSGTAWPFVYVQGILQVNGDVTGSTTIEAQDGRLKINGNYVYQYGGEGDDDSVDGISSSWHAIGANGGGHTTNPTGSVTNTSTTGTARTEYTYTLTDGATSGTNWSISGSNLALTVPGNTVPATYTGTWRLRIPANAFRDSEDFESPNGEDFFYTPGVLASTADTAVGSAKALQQQAPGAGSGVYWIKNVNGQNNQTSNAKQLYCDMSTDGGGWTRFFNYDAGTQNGTYNVQYSNQDYNISSMSSSNLDSLHYSCRGHRENRQQYSTGSKLSYLFEMKGGQYKFKVDGYFEGDPGSGSRNAARIAGYSNSHFDFGWFNNSNNGYWQGNSNSTTMACNGSTDIGHNLNGANTYNGGYFYVSRGYKSNPGSSSGCGDHCGNTRRHWIIYPYIGYSQHCYSGYNSYSHGDGGGRCSVYYRERGTIPNSGL